MARELHRRKQLVALVCTAAQLECPSAMVLRCKHLPLPAAVLCICCCVLRSISSQLCVQRVPSLQHIVQILDHMFLQSHHHGELTYAGASCAVHRLLVSVCISSLAMHFAQCTYSTRLCSLLESLQMKDACNLTVFQPSIMTDFLVTPGADITSRGATPYRSRICIIDEMRLLMNAYMDSAPAPLLHTLNVQKARWRTSSAAPYLCASFLTKPSMCAQPLYRDNHISEMLSLA